MPQLADATSDPVPSHVAIIMDGNGRWAKARKKPRPFGHKAGVNVVQNIVKLCAKKGIRALTLFAFSSENWKRPQSEVGALMELFLISLQRESKKLNKNGIRLRFIGDRSQLADKLVAEIEQAESLTRENAGLQLVVAANYGGRWDIVQAAQRLAQEVAEGNRTLDAINETSLSAVLATADLPEPDLLIRTGGEQRISNFLLWQCAYAELYFTDVLWPDFDQTEFNRALADFAHRQRRFGKTTEQLEQKDA